jgi:hypothetical protein
MSGEGGVGSRSSACRTVGGGAAEGDGECQVLARDKRVQRPIGRSRGRSSKRDKSQSRAGTRRGRKTIARRG